MPRKTNVTNQEDDKIVVRGHRACFHVTILTNKAIWDPFGKNRAQPKTSQKGEICFDDACGIVQNLT